MKKILPLLAVLVWLSSCKKENIGTPSGIPGSNEKHIIQVNNLSNLNDKQLYQYDSKGRLTGLEYTEDKTSITYNGNTATIVENRKTENNREVARYICTLDAKGRIISAIGATNYILNTIDSLQLDYQYTADGYLEKLVRTYKKGLVIRHEYAYTDGDLTSDKYYENNVLQYEETMGYYSDKENKTGFSEHYATGYLMNKGMEGKANKHLVKWGKQTRSVNVIGWSYDRTWELDAEGYPVKSTFSGGTWNDTYEYIYNK